MTSSLVTATSPPNARTNLTFSNNNSVQIIRLPLSLAHTEFHYLVLYEDRIQVVSLLNQEVVWEESLLNPKMKWGKPKSLSYDADQNTLWMCTERAVFEVEVNREDR